MINPFTLLGLGNPGNKYSKTRHNIGKDWIAKIASSSKSKVSTRSSLYADYFFLNKLSIHLYMSNSYVNDSYKTFSRIIKYHKNDKSKFFVVHDDIDLSIGKIRLKCGGGHGGHNGLRNIIQHFGEDFYRFRIGIGHPGNKDLVTDWVLTKFSPSEKNTLDNAFIKFQKSLDILAKDGIENCQKFLNTD